MSSQRKQWVIPPSYDLGVHFYYRNLLKGSDYLQKFLRESVALIDRDLGDKYQALLLGGTAPSDWMMSYDGFMDILSQAGLSKNIVDQISYHIDHIAGGIGKDINYLKVKEFLAYCGIEGIYDLENKKHFVVQQSDYTLPKTIDPQKYRAAPDREEIRRNIAYMMDPEGTLASLDRDLLALEDRVWGDYLKQVGTLFDEKTTAEERQSHYFKTRPDLAALQQEALDLKGKRDALVEELKDRYAPINEDFSLPAVGTEFDKNWYDRGENEIGIQRPFRERFAEHMERQGKRKGDPEFDSFSWKEMRLRSFSIFDYAIRDFTMNSTNRGEIAEHRRYDIPRAFVKSVRAEIEDGLLEALKLPYRIEKKVEGSYAIICNDCEGEVFTLEQLAELEKKLDEEDSELEEKALPAKPSDFMPAPLSPVQPQLTQDELATMASERLATIRKLLTQPDGTVPNIEVNDPDGGLILDNRGAVQTVDEATRHYGGVELKLDSGSVYDVEDNHEPKISEIFPEEKAQIECLPEIPDDELPFPEAGLMGDELSEAADNADKKDVAEDEKVLEFENVLPLVNPNPHSNSKNKEKRHGEVSMDSPKMSFTGEPKKGKPAFGGHGNSLTPDAMGGGVSPYVRPNNTHLIGINLGLDALGRGLKNVGQRIGKSLKSGQSSSVAELEPLGLRANHVVSIKNQIASGLDENGSPMTPAGEADLWRKLNDELDYLRQDIQASGKPKTEDSAEYLKNLANKMRETSEFAKTKTDSDGQIADLAKQAQKMAEEMGRIIARLIEGITKMFSRVGPK